MLNPKRQTADGQRAAGLAFLLLLPAADCAAERWHASLGLATDYVWRGVSQTQGHSAAQAALGFSAPSGWYAGTWTSANLGPRSETRDAARAEVDLFAGYRREFAGKWLLDFSVVRYWHPDDGRSLDYDYTELVTTLGYDGRFNLTVALSPDTSMYTGYGLAAEETALAAEFAVIQPLAKGLSLTGGLGYYDLGDAFAAGYTYWNAGFAWEVGRIGVDVTHIRTDRRARELFGTRLTDPRTVLSLIVAF